MLHVFHDCIICKHKNSDVAIIMVKTTTMCLCVPCAFFWFTLSQNLYSSQCDKKSIDQHHISVSLLKKDSETDRQRKLRDIDSARRDLFSMKLWRKFPIGYTYPRRAASSMDADVGILLALLSLNKFHEKNYKKNSTIIDLMFSK